MSLNFNYQKCLKNETLKQTDLQFTDSDGNTVWSGMAYTMPFAMMAIDMGSITESNADEVWRRIHLWQCLNGNLTHVGGEPYFLTKQHVRACIGFGCNVATITPSQFNKKLLSFWKDGSHRTQHDTLRCSECETIAHGLREDGRCPNCNPYTKEDAA